MHATSPAGAAELHDAALQHDTLIETKPAPHTTSTSVVSLATTDLLSIDDLSPAELAAIIDATIATKQLGRGAAGKPLAEINVTMLFEKPSLRTRMSFEIGLTRLGAHVIYNDHAAKRIGQRESVKDYAKNLERWTDAIVARVFDHNVLVEMAEHAQVPVVNALSDVEHPCQALADMVTLAEHAPAWTGKPASAANLSGLGMAWMGDGNNVCHSLMLACAMLGVRFTAITPKGFEPQMSVVRRAAELAKASASSITLTHSLDAIKGHDAVYTDCWVSMGQDHQASIRGGAFAGFQIDSEVMGIASKGVGHASLFMHCLPAHRGEEVLDEVIDSDASVVYDQAENRMHAQNTLMTALLAATSRSIAGGTETNTLDHAAAIDRQRR